MTDRDRLQKLADQIIGLAGYVEKKLKTSVRYHGFPGGEETTPKTGRPFMLRQPEGTRFAVLTDAVLADYGDRLHWTYAEKRGGKITFKDFQLDREGNPEPGASDYPLGPNKNVYKTDNILMTVLAFGDGLVGGGEL
jgi:RNase P/RNase MRP subunit p29